MVHCFYFTVHSFNRGMEASEVNLISTTGGRFTGGVLVAAKTTGGVPCRSFGGLEGGFGGLICCSTDPELAGTYSIVWLSLMTILLMMAVAGSRGEGSLSGTEGAVFRRGLIFKSMFGALNA